MTAHSARVLELFWAKVDKEGPSGCWVWTAVTKKGYGIYRTATACPRAHRFAYELLVGPIPEGLDLDHLCRNRACVNPAHLEPVTRRENLMRGEGPTGLNARKTHCINGHEFTPENTRRTSRGGRDCRECNRIRSREWKLSHKVAA